MNPIAISIEIAVPLAIREIEPQIEAIIQKQADEYAALLCQGLGIPAEISSKVNVKKEATDHWFELRIGGQSARVRYSQGLPEQFFKTLPIGAGILEDICRNRSLLATSEVVAYAAHHATDYFQQASTEHQAEIVSHLFHLGFGLGHLKQFSSVPTNTSEALALAENCIGGLEATSIRMYACAAEIDPDDDPNDFNRLVEALELATNETFKQIGIPVPAIKTEVRENLEPGHFYFRLNDLFLPKRNVEGVQAQFVYLVSLLKEFGYCFINQGSVHFLLESLEPTSPNLLSVFRAKFSTDQLVFILRQLLEERLAIRALVRILEIMVGGDDTYVVPTKKWFPTPISENVVFLGEAKELKDLSTAEWSDFVRMYYKAGLRNLSQNFIQAANPNMVKTAMGLNLHEYCQRLKAAEGTHRTEIRFELHQQLTNLVHQSMEQNPQGWSFCINTLAPYRSVLQEAIRYEFPEIAVFSNQELLLINLTADQSYPLSL